MKKELKVEGMMCQNCVKHVTKALEGVPGATQVSVSLENKTAAVTVPDTTGDDVLKAAVEEAARSTDGKQELTEEMKAIIDAKIQAISEHPDAEPQVTITYFKPDERKEGGAYVRVTGAVKEIDRIGKTIVLTDHTEIPMEQIREIEAEWMRWMDRL